MYRGLGKSKLKIHLFNDALITAEWIYFDDRQILNIMKQHLNTPIIACTNTHNTNTKQASVCVKSVRA